MTSIEIAVCALAVAANVVVYVACGWEFRRIMRKLRRPERREWIIGMDLAQRPDEPTAIVTAYRAPDGTLVVTDVDSWIGDR